MLLIGLLLTLTFSARSARLAGEVLLQTSTGRDSAAFVAAEAAARALQERPITFVTVRDSFFRSNLGRSRIWLERATLPHEWLLLDNSANIGISNLYAQAQRRAAHDLMVFLHADVFLPDDFHEGLMTKLKLIEELDPEWGVLGTAGVPLGWTPKRPAELKIVTSIRDCFGTYTSGTDLLPMQSLDEHLLVLRRGSDLAFDPQLPGFDLYGTDIVLQARRRGLKAYLLNLPLLHKLKDQEGNAFDPEEWSQKFADPVYQARAKATSEYVQKKWCSSGLLPTYGTAFDIEAC